MSLKIRKLDLHVHTPASYDFPQKKVSTEEIIQKAKAVELDGIAVTDHNSVSAIDEMVRVGKKHGVAIFPGFEISCHGAKEGPIHVIGIFDPSKTQTYLERVLGKLDIKKEGEQSITTKSVSDVINIIGEAEGLPVLAHANSTHGALSDIRGNPRIEVVQNQNLLAAEATDGDFSKKKGERLIDYLNGEDAQYKRKLAVYCASDNPIPQKTGHCLETIGSRFTYFKMGEFTLESLRQCFEDPDARIIQAFETEKLQTQQPRILEVGVEGGFLGELKIQFHSGMNSIIGGTGTGKSLLVEFLRFVFGKAPHTRLAKEYLDKLEKQLKDRGTVTVKFIDSSGDEYEISRTYNARKPQDSRLVCRNTTANESFDGDIASIFPLLFYSQNEVLEVTRDSKAQLDLLDNFRDFGRFRQESDRITGELKKLDRQFATSYESAENLFELEKHARTLTAQIKTCEKQIKAKAQKEFGDFDVLEQRRVSATEKEAIFDAFGTILQQAKSDAKAQADELPDDLNTIDSPEKEVAKIIRKTYGSVIGLFDKASHLIGIEIQNAARAVAAWEKSTKYSQKKAAYEKSIQAKSQLATIETKRKKLAGERDKLRTRIATSKVANQSKAAIRRSRSEHLKALQEIRTQYYDERKSQADLITDRSGEKLRINIRKQADSKKFRENLLKLKVRSYAEEKEIDSIISNLPVIDFVEAVLDRNAGKIAKAANIGTNKAESIINILRQPEILPGTLALQHESFPDDEIEILYKKQDGSYHPLPELSMGQKADALLMIALGDSQMPVIIDQPEDALDLSSIWDDICQRLRTSKHARQFLFTTHNSSVAVASDSDQFIVMDADATRGWVAEIGSIDQAGIKKKVVDHLEGGAKSYHLKRKKYNIK